MPYRCSANAESETIQNFSLTVFDNIEQLGELQWNKHIPQANVLMQHESLKLIQTIALVLSLILFANIVINALGKLRAGDKELEKAQRETTEILHTVKEGLFL